MTKFIGALSTVVLSTTLLVGVLPTQAQLNPDARVPESRILLNRHSVAINNVSFAATAAISGGATIDSLPNFTGSFTTDGVTYPFIFLGQEPTAGGTTVLDTDLIPIEFEFLDKNEQLLLDSNGDPIVVGPSQRIIDLTVGSPNFQNADYTVGTTQFADAIRLAEFFNVKGADWHTILNQPKVHDIVRAPVPFGSYIIILNADGTRSACIDIQIVDLIIQAVLDAKGPDTHRFPIILANNTILTNTGTAAGCGIVGFHETIDTVVTPNTVGLQVFAYASWITPSFTPLANAGFLDVLALSHEISEAYNDPFVAIIGQDSPFINLVPPFVNASGGCQDNLENGDFIEGLADPSFPITLNGFTYHPQNIQLLQWFSREVPSSAVDGAYSYPDESLLLSPSTPCTLTAQQ